MQTRTSRFALQQMLGSLDKGGTSAGAKRGWETRRGKAPVEEERQGSPPSSLWAKADGDIKRFGVAQVGDVHVKIVPLLMGEGFGVETTVAGDRRHPREPGMSLEEAQKFALGQLRKPRASQMLPPKPVAEPEPEKPKAPPAGRPYKNPLDLAAEYKGRGLDKYRAWDQFVIDTIMSPRYRSEPVDAKEFFGLFDRA